MIIATAGHVDHGKTSLIRALTGKDTDRLPEEKKRGLTIDLGFAYAAREGGSRLGFVDVPGHERFVANMLAGVPAVDAALLIVAADDGVMPQTREHLAILDLMGIGRGLVALTKIDRVDAARTAAVSAKIDALLAETSLAGAPVFPVSNVTGQGLDDLAATIDRLAGEIGARPATGAFRLAVDRAFVVAGAGLVVTGAVYAGEVAVDDTVVVAPAGFHARVRGIRALDSEVGVAKAGERAALNLAGDRIERGAIKRGDWIAAPGADQPTSRLDVRLRLLASEARVLKHWTPVHLHHGAGDVTARVAVIDGASVRPGAEADAQLVLDSPIVAGHRDRFVIRDQSATRTLGGGWVIDAHAPTRGRTRPERRAQVAAYALETPDAALAALAQASPAGVDLSAFARSRSLTRAELGALVIAGTVKVVGPEAARIAYAPEHWRQLMSRTLAAVDATHADRPQALGLTEPEILKHLPFGLGRPALSAALKSLIEAGEIARTGAVIHRPDHRARLRDNDRAIWNRLLPLLADAGLRPPRTREIATELGLEFGDLEAFLARAGSLGLVVRATHNRAYLPETVAALVELAEELATKSADGTFTVAEYRDRSGIGRNVTINVLEFLDRMGATRRRGEARLVLRTARDLIGETDNR